MLSDSQSLVVNGQLPLVSIVTPTYNQAQFIGETMSSVLNQTYPAIEYIVLDDGSTDATSEIIKSERRLSVAESQENMGQSRTLNKGWALAKGKYIGYLSSDDLIYPEAIEKMVSILEADINIACVFPDADLIDIQSNIIKKNVCREFDLENLIVRQECYIGPGALFRSDAFHVIGGWDPALKLAPDREFWIRLASKGRFVFCKETLAGYRLHSQSISYKDVSEEVSREYIGVLDRYFDGEMGTMLPGILKRRDEAYAYATMIIVRNCLRAGQYTRGLELYRQACSLYPGLTSIKNKIKLLRNVASKPVRSVLAKLRSLLMVK
jgi:glycosyltransferase involved in cell wall biosynthesis